METHSLPWSQYQPQSLTHSGAQEILVELSLIWTNVHKVTTIYFQFLDNAFPANAVSRVMFWAEGNVFKLAHQYLKKEWRVYTCWFTKTHWFYSFWAENQLGNMRGGRNVGMLILERPCQSATAVPQHKCILCYFSWKMMREGSERVLSASRCRQSAQPLQTGKEGWGGTASNGTQDAPAGARAFSDTIPDYSHVTWTSHCFLWFLKYPKQHT